MTGCIEDLHRSSHGILAVALGIACTYERFLFCKYSCSSDMAALAQLRLIWGKNSTYCEPVIKHVAGVDAVEEEST